MLPVYSAIVGFFLGLTISPSSALFLGLMLGLIAWAFTGFKITDKRSSIANVANDDYQSRSEQKSPNNLKNLKAIDLGRTLALSLSISANASDSELDEVRKAEIDIDKYRNEKFFLSGFGIMYAVMHELTDQAIIDELVDGFHDVFLNNAKNNLSSLLFIQTFLKRTDEYMSVADKIGSGSISPIMSEFGNSIGGLPESHILALKYADNCFWAHVESTKYALSESGLS